MSEVQLQLCAWVPCVWYKELCESQTRDTKIVCKDSIFLSQLKTVPSVFGVCVLVSFVTISFFLSGSHNHTSAEMMKLMLLGFLLAYLFLMISVGFYKFFLPCAVWKLELVCWCAVGDLCHTHWSLWAQSGCFYCLSRSYDFSGRNLEHILGKRVPGVVIIALPMEEIILWC